MVANHWLLKQIAFILHILTSFGDGTGLDELPKSYNNELLSCETEIPSMLKKESP